MSFYKQTEMLTNKKKSLLILLLLLLLFPILIKAQSVSGVTGVVTDSGGAVIPGVEVKLIDTKTSRETATTTNSQGVYTFNNIQPGSGYKLSFTAQGFQTFVLNEVQLGIGKTETQNAQLTIGQVSGVVEVTSVTGDATLNTTDASIGNVIGSRQLRDLPIRLRDNPAALIGLQPGVIGNNVGTGATNRVGSVTGARADQGNITVDGIDANDVTTGQAFVTIGNLPIDSVQEFRAVTTNPNASEGRSSGGQIQLATRSGSNDYHGSLREYFRTDKTAANTFFNNKNGVERPKLKRHQFGGSISGPLPIPNFGIDADQMFLSGKDRLFFFFDYEGRRDDSQTVATRTVPLQNFRDGRIGYINNNAGCTGASRQDTTPNCISFLTQAQASALDPRGTGVNQALLSFINSRYPQANDLTGGDGINTGLFRYNAPVVVSNNTYTPRIDWSINRNQTLFGRATITRNSQTNALELFPGDGDSTKLIDKSYQVVIGHTWVISPSFTNQATVGISRQKWDFPVPTSPAGLIEFEFDSILTNPFASIAYQNRDVTVPTFRNDLTWTTSSHTFQFGGQFKPIRQKTVLSSSFDTPTIGLGGNTDELQPSLRPANILNDSAGSAAGNYDTAFTFLLGRIAALNTDFIYDKSGQVQPLGTPRNRNYAYNEYEFYAQDNWKIRNDLTLNLGVRWHLYPAPYETNGIQAGNDVDFETLINQRVQNAANGVSGPSAEPFLTYTLIGKANDAKPFYKTDYNNFAPRVGFAYNPSFKEGVLNKIFGDRKTVIRGGGSMVYDRVAGGVSFILDQNTYIFDTRRTRQFGSLNPVTSLLNDPRFTGINSLPVQNTPGTVTNPFTPYVEGGVGTGLANPVGNYAIAQNFETPYSYQWSFGVQRELPANMIIDVSYVGRRGKKLFAQADAAQVLNFKDNASGQFLFDAFNEIQAQLASGVSAFAVTPQPWFDNQIGSALGTSCRNVNFGLGANIPCTTVAAFFFANTIRTGDTASLIASLASNQLLNPNVGMSSQFALNGYITNQGFSQYDGMLVSLQRRYSKGFEFDINYTLSHAIDNQSNVSSSTGGWQGLIYNAINPYVGRGNAEFDIRHLFNANAIWDVPIGRGRALGSDMPKLLNALIGGWTMSGIFTARSGYPLSSTTNTFPLNLIVNSPAVLNGSLPLAANIRDEGAGIQYFADAAAVQAALRYPKAGEVGSRNTFRSEGFFQLDMALSKKFKLPWSESHLLTFRAEAYNLTNTNFFTAPNLTYRSNNFGRITTSQSSARELQFALRYDF